MCTAGVRGEELKAAVATQTLAAAQTTTAKATSGLKLAMKGLWTALKPFATVAVVAAAIGGIVYVVDSLHISAEEAAEAAKNAQSEIDNINNSYKDHKKVVDECLDSYDKLSKGVNTLTNANHSLSDNEYAEYLQTTNKLAEAFPQLVKGFDENGDAILDIGNSSKSAAEEVRELLEEERKLADFKVAQQANDVFGGLKFTVDEANEATTNYENAVDSLKESRERLAEIESSGFDFDDKGNVNFTNVDSKTQTAIINGISDFYSTLSAERQKELSGLRDTNSLWNLGEDGLYDVFAATYDLTEKEKSDLLNNIKYRAAEMSEAAAQILEEYRVDSVTKNAEADAEWNAFIPTLVSSLKSNTNFQGLNSDIQDIAVKIVGSLDKSVKEEIESAGSIESYIQKVIVGPLTELSLKDIGEVNKKLNDLFTLNPNDLSSKNQDAIKLIISTLSNFLGQDENVLRIALGFEIDPEYEKEYNAAILDIANRFSEVGLTDVENIFSVHGIDTFSEIESFQEVAKEATTAAEAVQLYMASFKTEGDLSKPISDIVSGFAGFGSKFDSVVNAYQSFAENGKKGIQIDGLNEIVENFKDIEGINLDGFLSTMMSSTSTVEDCQEAYDKLTTEIIFATGILDGLTEATAEQAVRELESKGITNASVIVKNQLAAANEFAAATGKKLSAATNEEILAFLNEQTALGGVKAELAAYYLAKLDATTLTLSTSGDIENIMGLVEACGSGIEALKAFYRAKQGYEVSLQRVQSVTKTALSNRMLQTSMEQYQKTGTKNEFLTKYEESVKEVDDGLKEAEKLADQALAEIRAAQSNAFSGNATNMLGLADGSGGGGSDSSDSSDKLDYIPRKIEAVQDAYSKLIAEADNADNTYENQLNYLNAAIDKQEELVALQREAEGVYKTEWEIASSGLSEEEKNLIMNGGLVIANYSGDKADQMSKADEAWSAYKEQVEARQEAEKTLDENIRSRYSKQREWDEAEIDRLIEKSDIEQTSYDKVLSYLDEAKAKSQGLEDDMRKYAGEAKTAWDEAKAGIEAGDIAKIMNGELNVEDFADNKEYYAALLVAMGAYEDYQDAEEALNDAIEKNAETAKQAFEKALEVVQAQQDLANAHISSTEKTMDLIAAVGGNVHESMYKSMISDNKEVIDLYEEQIALIEDRISEVDEESAEYYQLQAQIQDCEQAIMDCKIQQAEWNESIKRLPINRLSTYIQMLQNIKQDLQNFIDEVGVLRITPNKEQYQSFIDMNQKEIDALVKQQTKLQGILGDYKYGSEKYTEVSNEIQDIENQISSLIQQQYEYNQSLLMIPIEDMAEQVDRLAATKTRLEQEIAEDNAKGLSTTIDQYKQLMSVTLQQLTMLTSQKAALTELLGVYDVNSDKYTEIQGQIDGIDSSISDLVQQQYAWNAEILNMPIENLEKINDNLSNYSSILDGVIGELDSALSGVNALIDGEIKGVQEVLDTLNKSNEARRVQLALEQAQYNLEKARNQKNIQVIRDGQLVYESDQDALRAANEEMSNAEYDKMVYNLEQQISYLETIKEKWQDVIDEIERANQIQDATKLFGDGSKWQEAILGGNDESLLAMFENLYSSTTSQKESIDEQIESNERLVQMMGEFVTRYQEGSLTYESALQGVNAMIKASENGFTALESLSGMMDLDNISALDQITSSTQEAISDAAGLFSQYLGIVEANKSATEAFETNWSEVAGAVDKTLSAFGEAIGSIDSYLSAFESNTDAINKNVSTWEQMKDNLEKQVAALEKAAAELEKWASTPQKKPSSSSSGGGSSSGSSGGGSYIWAGGKAHSESEGSAADIIMNYGSKAEQDRYWDYRESVINNSPHASDSGWKEAALKALEDEKNKYHSGIEKGFINSNGSSLERLIKSVAINPLKSDEVLRVLQKGEGVFTQPQMSNLVNNSMLMGRMLEKTSGAIHASGSGGQLIDCSIGELHLHEVQNVDEFAKALDQSFASTMQQQMKKYNLQS